MAYDALAESVRLIENGVPGCVASRVSRRIRHIPLAVDMDGRIAAAMFLRRGQGQVWCETHVLVRRHGSWRVEGGGGATGGEYAARDAPGHEDLAGISPSAAAVRCTSIPLTPRFPGSCGTRPCGRPGTSAPCTSPGGRFSSPGTASSSRCGRTGVPPG